MEKQEAFEKEVLRADRPDSLKNCQNRYNWYNVQWLKMIKLVYYAVMDRSVIIERLKNNCEFYHSSSAKFIKNERK